MYKQTLDLKSEKRLFSVLQDKWILNAKDPSKRGKKSIALILLRKYRRFFFFKCVEMF